MYSYNYYPYCITEPFSKQYLICLAISAFSRIGLILFFIISGYLLIKEYNNKSITNFYKKRIIRIVPLFILWSFIYYLWGYDSFNLINFVKMLFANPIAAHLWFIYVLIGIYIITPFISNILVSTSYINVFNLCFISMLSFTMVPFIEYCNINRDLIGMVPHLWIIYFISGYFLIYFIKNKKFSSLKILIYFLIAFFAIYVLSFFTKNSVTPLYDIIDPRPYDSNIAMWIASCCLFILLARYFNIYLPKFIYFISKRSYGIYLSHVLYINLFYKFFTVQKWYLSILFCFIFVLLLSVVIEFLLINLKSVCHEIDFKKIIRIK